MPLTSPGGNRRQQLACRAIALFRLQNLFTQENAQTNMNNNNWQVDELAKDGFVCELKNGVWMVNDVNAPLLQRDSRPVREMKEKTEEKPRTDRKRTEE